MKVRSRKLKAAAWVLCAIFFCTVVFFMIRGICFRRPQKDIVEGSGLETALVYSIIKTESGFDERAESGAGAVGLMQLLPSTAEFVCRLNGICFSRERLSEGGYNVRLGCLYLKYLLERFEIVETAVAAYNAGEGVVSGWLKDRKRSADGKALDSIPYKETAQYVKKVEKFRKIYRFFYD